MQRMALSSNSSGSADGHSSLNTSTATTATATATDNGNGRNCVKDAEGEANVGAIKQSSSATSAPSLNESPHADIKNHQRISPNCSFSGKAN